MASTTIDSDMRALLEWVFVNGLDEDNSGFIEEREAFTQEYLDFLDAADGVKTSRELILDPSLDALKSKSL